MRPRRRKGAGRRASRAILKACSPARSRRSTFVRSGYSAKPDIFPWLLFSSFLSSTVGRPFEPSVMQACRVGIPIELHTGCKCNRGMHRIFRPVCSCCSVQRATVAGWQLVRGPLYLSSPLSSTTPSSGAPPPPTFAPSPNPSDEPLLATCSPARLACVVPKAKTTNGAGRP